MIELLRRQSNAPRPEPVAVRDAIESTPGLAKQVDAALESMLKEGFGHLRPIASPTVRAERAANAKAAFFRVMKLVHPDLRRDLFARLDRWPPYQIKWVVQRAVNLGLRENLKTPNTPTPTEIEWYESMWRQELKRDPAIAEFRERARLWTAGPAYPDVRHETPELVSAAIAMSKIPWMGALDEHAADRRHAVLVLSQSRSERPELDAALRWFMAHGQTSDRWRAALGLLARGKVDVSMDLLLERCRDPFECITVLGALRKLYDHDCLDRIPAAALGALTSEIAKHEAEVDATTRADIVQHKPGAIAFAQRIGIIGPKTAQAIAAAQKA